MSKFRKLCFSGPLWIFITMVAIVLALAGTLAVLWKRNQNDFGHHLEFRIEKISLSSFNSSGNQATRDWNVVFSVENGFNFNVFYPRIDATLFYKRQVVAAASIAAFHQKKGSKMQMNAAFVASTANKEFLAYFLPEKNGGSVWFDLVFQVGYHMDGKDYLRDTHLDVICENVRVGFSVDQPNGALLDGVMNCPLYL